MTDYNQAQSGSYATGPVTVDVNGVPVAAVAKQIASPGTTLVTIALGVSTQIIPQVSETRSIKLANIGWVPIYYSNSDPGPSRVTSNNLGGSASFVYVGTRVAPGESTTVSTVLPLYVTVRPVGGVGLVNVVT